MRPTCHPILSRFCINLTGITQSKVDCSEPFSVVYERFNDWIQQIQSKKGLRFATPSERRPANGINATFCTWSSSDLEIYMKIESERMNSGIASYFRTWIDARVYYNVSWHLNYLHWIEHMIVFNLQLFLVTFNLYHLIHFLSIEKIRRWTM